MQSTHQVESEFVSFPFFYGARDSEGVGPMIHPDDSPKPTHTEKGSRFSPTKRDAPFSGVICERETEV